MLLRKEHTEKITSRNLKSQGTKPCVHLRKSVPEQREQPVAKAPRWDRVSDREDGRG